MTTETQPDKDQKKRSIPELNVDTQVLWRLLQKLQPGELIAYETLNAAIKGDVQGKSRGLLNSARRKALMEDRIVTECVIGKGIKRMVDDDIALIHEHAVTHIRKHSRNACRKQQCADYAALTEPKKRAYNTGQSILGVLGAITKPARMKQLEDKVGKQMGVVSFKETLSLFATNGEGDKA